MGLKTKLRPGSKVQICNPDGEVVFTVAVKHSFVLTIDGYILRENIGADIDDKEKTKHNETVGAA